MGCHNNHSLQVYFSLLSTPTFTLITPLFFYLPRTFSLTQILLFIRYPSYSPLAWKVLASLLLFNVIIRLIIRHGDSIRKVSNQRGSESLKAGSLTTLPAVSTPLCSRSMLAPRRRHSMSTLSSWLESRRAWTLSWMVLWARQSPEKWNGLTLTYKPLSDYVNLPIMKTTLVHGQIFGLVAHRPMIFRSLLDLICNLRWPGIVPNTR